MPIRLNIAELASLKSLSIRTGINQSSLMRQAIRSVTAGCVEMLDREHQAIMEVAGKIRFVGVDLNQIARLLNAGKELPSQRLAEVFARMEAVLLESVSVRRGLNEAARDWSIPKHGRR